MEMSCTTEGQLWRYHANQMRALSKEVPNRHGTDATDASFWNEDSQRRLEESWYSRSQKTGAELDDDVVDRTAAILLSQSMDRWGPHRRPPNRLRVNL
ncbi:hypothetical protein GCK32_010535 [Trichostrongylus colubriformis]|uniref:Uncharacterized protein n=1 Tax=Trichostrongylus colubriformis TaxID=6319 RepID=A0AAN8F2X0_TRICO